MGTPELEAKWGKFYIREETDMGFDPTAHYPELPPATYTSQLAELRFLVLELRRMNETLASISQHLIGS